MTTDHDTSAADVAAQEAANKAADKGNDRPPPAMLTARGKLPNGKFGTILHLHAVHPDAGKKIEITGFVVTKGKYENVFGFFNKADDGRKSIALKKVVPGAEGAADTYEVVGYGNAVNTNKKGDPVFFDTVVFNIGGESIGAHTPKGTAPELREKIGFTSDMVERPKKVAADAPAGDAEAETEGEAQASVERPRGG